MEDLKKMYEDAKQMVINAWNATQDTHRYDCHYEDMYPLFLQSRGAIEHLIMCLDHPCKE